MVSFTSNISPSLPDFETPEQIVFPKLGIKTDCPILGTGDGNPGLSETTTVPLGLLRSIIVFLFCILSSICGFSTSCVTHREIQQAV